MSTRFASRRLCKLLEKIQLWLGPRMGEMEKECTEIGCAGEGDVLG